MKIYREPVFEKKYLSYKTNNVLPFPFKEENLLLFGYGRAALYEGLKALGIKEGDAILLPEYICNVVAAPMHRLNIKIKFYEVSADLAPVSSSLEQEIDKSIKALLIVNYFGFPNLLDFAKDFCEKHGIYLIEDNAHSFLSSDNGKSLGATGDISFFSFRKILPLPNGAALLINNKSLKNRIVKPEYLQKKNTDLSFFAKNSLLKLRDFFPSFAFSGVKATDFDKARIKDAAEEFNIQKYFVVFSKFSHFLLRHFNFDYVKEERRKAYNEWLNLFSSKWMNNNARVVFPVLKAGVVPSCFPVLVQDQKQFISEMWKKGIECFPWPFLPGGSRENYLTCRMVCLPVFPHFKLKKWIDGLEWQ